MRPRRDGARGSTVIKALASDARGPWLDPQIRNQKFAYSISIFGRDDLNTLRRT